MCPKDSVLSDPAPSSSGYNRPNLFSVFLSPRDLVTMQPRLMSPSTRTTQLLWVTLGGGVFLVLASPGLTAVGPHSCPYPHHTAGYLQVRHWPNNQQTL